jgi:uncharacterized protein YciI
VRSVKHSMLLGLLFGLLSVHCLCNAREDEPPVYFVLLHSPGPNWNHDLSLSDQPGIEQHRRYMNELKESGKIILGGPYLDGEGSMTIFQMGTIEEARLAAHGDPAVKAGLLQVAVKTWQVDLSSVRLLRKRKPLEASGRNRTFKIKSANQGAPINLEEGPN